jgi:hypothetical protein
MNCDLARQPGLRLASCHEVSLMLAACSLRVAAIWVLLAPLGPVVSATAADPQAPGTKTPARDDSKVQAVASPLNKFCAVLPDGATFELLGVGESTANDKAWWNGDGSARAKRNLRNVFRFVNQTPFQAKDANLLNRLFVFECTHKGDASVSEPTLVGETKDSSSGSWSMGLLGSEQMQSTLSVEILPQSRATVRLKYAAGKWTTIATCPATRGIAVELPQGGVLFGDPVEKEGGVLLPVAVKSNPEAYRLVAIDHASREHHSTFGISGLSEGIRLLLPRFQNLPLARIKEFRLQMRTWQQIEFRNISLHRGQKTNFAIYIDDKPYPPQPAKAP